MNEGGRLFSDLIGALRPKGDRWRGCLMGDFTGNVDAPIDGWKYVRIPIAGTGDYALGMFPSGGSGGTEYNTPVLIEYDPINHQRIIAGADSQAIGATVSGPTITDPGGFSLPAHGWTHQLGGNDQLLISREQLGNLQISPSATARHVTVSGGVCVIDGVLIKIYLPLDVDLTAYYPATGVKYIWLTLTAAGAISVIDPAVTDITALTWPGTNNHVLGFVMLKALLTTINWGAIKSVFDVVKGVTSYLPAATAQYQVITSGPNPYPAAWSTFLLGGTAGGKTNFAVTNTKILTLTATDDFNLTAERTGAVIVRTIGAAPAPQIVGDIAGNARGQYAVDLQLARAFAGRVAIGDYAVALGGRNNFPAGDYSIALGYNTTASGVCSWSWGFASEATGDYSVAFGREAYTGANAGVFIWGDSTTEAFNGIIANEFAIRARGGFRHAYDNSNYWQATVSAVGVVTFNATGASAGFIFSDVVTLPAAGLVVTGMARGDLLTGNATPAFGRLALGGIAGSVVTRDATDVLWSAGALSFAGAFTLTIPATGTAALLGTANVFTANNVFGSVAGVRTLTLSSTDAGVALYISGAAATSRDLQFQTAGVVRWIIRAESTAESGSNAGSNFQLLSRTDAGAPLATVMSATRSTGAVNFAGDVTAVGDIYTAAYADYSATSTIVGWSAFTTKVLYYKKVGKLVFVWFKLAGTSNSTAVTFTVPYNMASAPDYIEFLCRSSDNGGAPIVGEGIPVANSNVITLYPNLVGDNWTASGTKHVFGWFVYQSA